MFSTHCNSHVIEKQKHLQRITKIKDFIDKYNCKGMNYPSVKKLFF